MDNWRFIDWEKAIDKIAEKYPYPRTPDIFSKIEDIEGYIETRQRKQQSRLILRAILVTSVLFIILMSVPTVRAAIVEFIQIGVVRIFHYGTVQTQPVNEQGITDEINEITPTVVYTLMDLAGEITLEKAESLVDFPVLAPSYPIDLGKPDRVILQKDHGQMLILIWLKEDNKLINVALVAFGPGANVGKDVTKDVKEILVNDQPAIWIDEPHTLWLNARLDYQKDVPIHIQGNVLIWQEGEVTYRLETYENLEGALRAASSLQPIP